LDSFKSNDDEYFVSIKDTNPTPPCKETYIIDGRLGKHGYYTLLESAAASMIRNVYIALNDNAECKTLLRSRKYNTKQHTNIIPLYTDDDYELWINILKVINPALVSSTSSDNTLLKDTEEVKTLLTMLSKISQDDHINAISEFCKFFYKRLFPETVTDTNLIVDESFTTAK
jgi:hypothetical protein